MAVVIVFGAFDPLHDGHRSLFTQARALGDALIVVAARDSYITAVKGRPPRVAAPQRAAALAAEPAVGQVVWGDEWPSREPYRLLRDLDFDIVALGYDQEPADEAVRSQLAAYGKGKVRVVRCLPHQSESLKSSRL